MQWEYYIMRGLGKGYPILASLSYTVMVGRQDLSNVHVYT